MMITLVLALLAVQQQPAPVPDPNPDPTPMRPLDPLEEPQSATRSTAEARAQIAAFGACVADASPDKAAIALRQDFRTTTYRIAMQRLRDNNSGCYRQRGRMRASTLLIAGAMAERLLARDATPLGKRLVLAAGRPAIATFTPSDAAAVCVVRSDPDDVTRLFAAKPAGADEAKALAPLRSLFGRCAGRAVEGTDEGMRAMLATAAFRSVAADGAQSSAK